MVENFPEKRQLGSVIGNMPSWSADHLQRKPDPTLRGCKVPGRVALLLVQLLAPDLTAADAVAHHIRRAGEKGRRQRQGCLEPLTERQIIADLESV